MVIARVISLGDTNSYFLSCAENELGVVIAYSEAGNLEIYLELHLSNSEVEIEKKNIHMNRIVYFFRLKTSYTLSYTFFEDKQFAEIYR